MYINKKILGVITARGGSKGIPGKNIKLLEGKPLIAYTIEAALASRFLTRCIVSTDDQEIVEISKKYGADVPFLRPAELAQDRSASMAVVQHALNWLKENQGEEYDYLMILQPTSPLRTAQDIDACIQKIIDTDADSVMSMVLLENFALEKIKRIENDVIVPFDDGDREGRQSTPRQFLDKAYRRNGAVFITKTDLITRGDLFGQISRPYMMPTERSVDINEPADLELVEFYLQKFKKT
ncbi:MAG: acylneuraminate cytidylyltransferase family protein [Patescibacteria group bacterium]